MSTFPQPGLERRRRKLPGQPVGGGGDPYTGHDRFRGVLCHMAQPCQMMPTGPVSPFVTLLTDLMKMSLLPQIRRTRVLFCLLALIVGPCLNAEDGLMLEVYYSRVQSPALVDALKQGRPLTRFTMFIYLRNTSQRELTVATRCPKWTCTVDGTRTVMLPIKEQVAPTGEVVTESKDDHGLVTLKPQGIAQLPVMYYTTDDERETAADFAFFYSVSKPIADALGLWHGQLHTTTMTDVRQAKADRVKRSQGANAGK